MDKKKKNFLMILIYAVLLVLCFAVVTAVDRLISPPVVMEESRTTGEENQDTGDRDGSGDLNEGITESRIATPSDAEAVGGETPKVVFRETVPPPVIEEETLPLEEKAPPVLVIASDIHYFSPDMTDYGEAFETMVKRDDGKVVSYIPELMAAFTEDMGKLQPDVVVLSGDLTLNGEKAGHEALAEKLKVLEEKGIQVLVIPGNHDINNPHAASYYGKEKQEAEGIDSGQFLEIYKRFGYDQAISRDEASLSYVYPLDPDNWLLMLDSAQYEPYNKAGGKIREKTLVWMGQILKLAAENGIHVIPIAHHNLLKESILYPEDCTLENSKEVTALLERYRTPVYLSGHLHLQRTKKYKSEPGESEEVFHISEIVADSMAIPVCQYGVLTWTEDNRLIYATKEVDVEGWALEQGVADENLLNFKAYGTDFLIQTISNQIYSKMSSLPVEQMEEMSQLYGDLNRAYCAGLPVDSQDVKSSPAFRLWERNLFDSSMFAEMDGILRDTKRDHNMWEYQLEAKEKTGDG